MATMKWVALLAFLLPVQSFAVDNSSRVLSRFEVQHDLFVGGTDGLVPSELFPEEGTAKKKSNGLAAIYSLLLPGMGELYADGFESGKYFLIAEGVLWLTYATFEIYGNQLRDDSRAFAQSHAGVIPSDKKDQYWVDIGNFIDVYEYNDKKLRDREPGKLYDSPSDAWRWDTDFSRSQFRDQRIASDHMYNNEKFVVAAILINHVASAINAVRSAIKYNKSLDDALGELDIRA
ncbi:MAG TPA: hypothetical protein DGH68_06675, partial [Bacteroidetes bacterium]|nr:hypothetical protein [Bacteroidota bacterium]